MFIDLLKNNGEDFEWYPTTDEIIECLQRDLIKWCIKNEPYNRHKNDISFHSSYTEDEKDRIDIPSFLDVGTETAGFLIKSKEIKRTILSLTGNSA
jgi:hypothetical protein